MRCNGYEPAPTTYVLQELLELDERQDATHAEPQVNSSPVPDPPLPQPATTPPSELAAIVSPPPVMLEPTIVDLPPETDSESEAHSVVGELQKENGERLI